VARFDKTGAPAATAPGSAWASRGEGIAEMSARPVQFQWKQFDNIDMAES
jgi:hypothetical protein